MRHFNTSLFFDLSFPPSPLPPSQTDYITEMKSISQTVGGLSLFPPTTLQLLHNLSFLHVQWNNFTSLTTDDLFQEGFAGMDSLVRLLTTMVSRCKLLVGVVRWVGVTNGHIPRVWWVLPVECGSDQWEQMVGVANE